MNRMKRIALANLASPSSQPTKQNVKPLVLVGVGGLVVGLILGVVMYAFVFSNSPTPSGSGTNNQVTVYGAAGRLDGTIYFVSGSQSEPDYISTTCRISEGKYSVLVVGNRTYSVRINSENRFDSYYTLFVPTGVAAFNHDF